MKKLSVSQIKEILNKYGLKATNPRIYIYKILRESKEHPSVEMIVNQLEKLGIYASLGSVYNVLDVFCEKGLCIKLKDEQEVMRYDGNTDFHIHVYNTQDGSISDIEDEQFCGEVTQYFESKFNKDEIERIDLSVKTR